MLLITPTFAAVAHPGLRSTVQPFANLCTLPVQWRVTCMQAAGRPLYRGAFTRGSGGGGALFNPLDLRLKNVANTGQG